MSTFGNANGFVVVLSSIICSNIQKQSRMCKIQINLQKWSDWSYMQIFISMFDTATIAKLNWFVSCDPFSRFFATFWNSNSVSKSFRWMKCFIYFKVVLLFDNIVRIKRFFKMQKLYFLKITNLLFSNIIKIHDKNIENSLSRKNAGFQC